MIELWDKWKHRLIFGVCVWVLLAFVFLSQRSTSGLLSADTGVKIWKTFGDIILLKWVTKYQTLLAGLAAVAGGAFVLLAAVHSAEVNRRQKEANRIEQLINSCTIISHKLHEAAAGLLKSSYDGPNLELEIVRDHIQPLTSAYRDIAISILTSASNCSRYTADNIDTREMQQTLRIHSLLSATICDWIAEHSKSGINGDIKSSSINIPHWLAHQILSSELPLEDFSPYFPYFDWTAFQQNS